MYLQEFESVGRAIMATQTKLTTVVAVDGPAGSGKSSICALVASRLGWGYLNTGAIYRGVAVLAREAHATGDDEFVEIAEQFAREARWDIFDHQLTYRGRNLTPELQSSETAQWASRVAKIPAVRAGLFALQRAWALGHGVPCIVDGRDIGTVIFPDADFKIYMTASIEERARRRLLQSTAADGGDLAAIKCDIARRDEQDQSRRVAPLKQSADAVLFDNSAPDREVSVAKIIQLLRDAGLVKP